MLESCQIMTNTPRQRMYERPSKQTHRREQRPILITRMTRQTHSHDARKGPKPLRQTRYCTHTPGHAARYSLSSPTSPRFDQSRMAGIRACATPVRPLPLQERRRGERKFGQERSRGGARRPGCCRSCVGAAAFRAVRQPQGGKSRRISRPRAGTEGRKRVQCSYVL